MTNPDLLKRRFLNIKASSFAGGDDEETSAYTGKTINPDKLVVALPARLPSELRKIRVFYRDKIAECVVDDVGPHSEHDPYWKNEDDPKPQHDRDGLDMTPAVWEALGADEDLGHVRIDWEFILPNKLPKNY